MFKKSLALALLCFSAIGVTQTLNLDHGFYQINYDCASKSANYIVHITARDGGQNERVKPFTQDPKLPEQCRPHTTWSFKTLKGMPKYDRGHLLDQNIVDDAVTKMKQTNYFSNIVPMAASLNRRGLWRHTEKLTECLRDKPEAPVLIISGVIRGNDVSNDFFVATHGMPTPDHLFKIVRTSQRLIAWVMPNDTTPKADAADDYVTSVAEIEALTGYQFPQFSDAEKQYKATNSWGMPGRCDLS